MRDEGAGRQQGKKEIDSAGLRVTARCVPKSEPVVAVSRLETQGNGGPYVLQFQEPESLFTLRISLEPTHCSW